LSEGEKKLILIECITKVLADKNSVLLFDEPDAHTHIARKKDILKAIELSESQTILTTHSPIFINHMVNNNIYPIDNGCLVNTEQRDLISKMANNSINYIDGACLISSKYLVLTEGPGDINYITAAIKACGKNDNQYKVLENVSFVYIGGANLVSEYYEEILSNLYKTLDRAIFVFDRDTEGREGAKQAQKLIAEGKDKIKVIYYNDTYPIVDPNNSDFYLEDMFPRSTYSIINLPNIAGTPTYAQLKKGSAWARNIKEKIADLYKKQLLKDEDYYCFKPFLLQLKQELGL
jgi:energy-coupling factor transporter ATP-binding protein EcfA2